MRPTLLLLFAVVCMPVWAEPVREEDHKGEVLRRGDLVTTTGEFNSGELCEGYGALELPEDDSHKWYITVLSIKNCDPCERLKTALNAGKLEAWVSPNDAQKSWAHYTVRFADDPLQKDWFKGLSEADLSGFPRILVQPPLNGDYGPSRTIVALLSWDSKADPDMKKLSKKLRDSIVKYASTVKQNKKSTAYSRGAKQSVAPEPPPRITSDTPTGKTPELPFRLDDADSRRPSRQPALPDQIPPDEPLTLKRMKELAPDAPAEFLLEQQMDGIVDPEKFELKWMIEKARKGPKNDPEAEGLLNLPGLDAPMKSLDKALNLMHDIQHLATWLFIVAVAFLGAGGVAAWKFWERLNQTITRDDFNKWSVGLNSVLETLKK